MVLGFISARPTPAHAAGTWHWFWFQDSTGLRHVRCVRLAAGPDVRVYAAPTDRVNTSDARSLVSTFERHILPTDVQTFGWPRLLTPVSILFVRLDGTTLGYFDQNDISPSAPGGDPTHSNRSNVLYVRLPATMPDADRLLDTDEVVAHELQHLIEYRLRAVDHRQNTEPDWLNEGLSFYAQLANGYWTPRDALKLQAATTSPWWPVTSLRNDFNFLRHNARLAYGRAGLFVTYLAARFGAPFVHDLLASADTGMAAVDDAIEARDPHADAGSAFADWGVAQYLDRTGSYGYRSFSGELRRQPSLALPEVRSYPFDSAPASSEQLRLDPWGQAYVRFDARGNHTLRIEVDGQVAPFRIAAILQDSNGVVQSTVRWLKSRSSGSMNYSLAGFGGLYDRVTLALSDVPSPITSSAGEATAIRLRARLVDVRDDDGVARPAPSAGHNAYFAFR
jgi:hypothetical protein